MRDEGQFSGVGSTPFTVFLFPSPSIPGVHSILRQGLVCWVCCCWPRGFGGKTYEETAIWLSTAVIPRADQAARSASAASAHERTVPFRMTLLPSTSTLILLMSEAARRNACSILCWISAGATRALILIELIRPLTPIKRRTIFSASSFWNCHSTSPSSVTQPFATVTRILSEGTAASHSSA